MAVITSTVGSSVAAQMAYQQLRVQQANQNAARAEAAARSLRQQADVAQTEADRAQENARSLYVKSDQAQSMAGQARQGIVALRTQSEMQVQLGNTADQVSSRLTPASEDLGTEAAAAASPVINTSGQLTGTVVNVTA